MRLIKKNLQKISDTWCATCEMSSDTKDIVRLRLGPKSFISHVVYYKYCRTFDVFQYFETSNPGGKSVSLESILLHRPNHIRNGKQNTCMCVDCKVMRLTVSAFKNNSNFCLKT